MWIIYCVLLVILITTLIYNTKHPLLNNSVLDLQYYYINIEEYVGFVYSKKKGKSELALINSSAYNDPKIESDCITINNIIRYKTIFRNYKYYAAFNSSIKTIYIPKNSFIYKKVIERFEYYENHPEEVRNG